MSELQPGSEVTSSVRLVRPLAKGGMGNVWLAEHQGLSTQVVVKFIAKETAEHADALTRFKREASAAAAVKSPHVVQVFDHGITAGGLPFIVMELLEGRDLSDHLAANGPMAPRDVAALVAQVAKALAKAHQVGVIHRDIKPENIFLCDVDGGELFVKLLDFGVAKTQHRVGAATTTGQVVGTPFYMSPEQIVGDVDIDARTDVWSLGVVAFEALTGRRPFEGTTIGAITLAIHSPPPRMSAIRPDLPPAVDEWFARACAKKPADRFASAREAANALLAVIGDVPSGHVLLRAPAPSIAGDESSIITAAPKVERAATNLSSTFSVPRPERRGPPRLLFAGAVLAVGIVGTLAIVALRKPDATPAASAATAPAASSVEGRGVAEPAASAEPAPAASATAERAPAASAPAEPAVTASAPKPAAKPAATAPSHKPSRVRRKPRPDDDDIK